MRRRHAQNVAVLLGGASVEQRVAAEKKGLLLSPADVRLLKNEGVAGAAAVATLSDDDFRSVGIGVAACREPPSSRRSAAAKRWRRPRPCGA